jgi:hypothetical protein
MQLGCAQIDRLPAARPGTPLVQTVELDALTGDFDLFRHKILLIFRRGLLRHAVAYRCYAATYRKTVERLDEIQDPDPNSLAALD